MSRKKNNADEALLSTEIAQVLYSREQVLKSRKYAERKDLLCVLLSDCREYTLEEVDALIENYMKGRVK